MKLFLASYIRHPDSIKSLEKFVGGFVGKTIAYIPTASNGETGWESWKQGGSWEMINNLNAKVRLVVLESFRNKSVLNELQNVNVILFAGGVPGYLMYWIRRCEIDKNIENILKSNTIFVGSSAGAMIAGQSLEISEFGFVDGEIGAKEIKPLSLVDFDIYPHYDEKDLPQIKKLYTGKKMYLLKNGEQIIVDGDKIIVEGEERIIENPSTNTL